jgi:uncharacterized protein
MSFEIASRTIDYLLRERDLFNETSIIWEFIGGEPFIEIGLIDKISDYIKRCMYELDHPWFDSYRFSFSTNGIMYDDPSVQRYIKKNCHHLSIGITIDGIKEKHDLQRVYQSGKGSYDDVVRNIPLWLKDFPGASTKVTLSHDDLPYIKESVLHLWGLGIKEVNINVVFENAWQDGDDLVFEEQLVLLADHILKHGLHKAYSVSLFTEFIGKPLDPELDNQNWCGAGKMLAVDHEGNFYPCVRFAPYSLNNTAARVIGNCFQGIDLNRLRPFIALDRLSQSPQDCINCKVASGCAWCQGFNMDTSDTGTIYQRAVYICKMHKARVRANNYYQARLKQCSPI